MLPGQAEAARNRLESLINALIEASVSVLDEEEKAAFDGSTAWTPPRSRCSPAARPGAPGCAPATPTAAGTSARATTANARTTRESHCARFPGAGSHHRHHRPAARRAARLPEPHRRPGAGPARGDPGGTGARGGLRGRPRAQDRLAGLRPRLYPGPARAVPPPGPGLGYKPVIDYRADQLGIQANTGGAILVEGTWYCPALPQALITATTRLRDHAITGDLYHQQIAARCPYQLKRKDGSDTDGYQRLSCPALGRHPALMCPLRAGLAVTTRRARQGTQPPPGQPQDLPPDGGHHRPGHRRPLPPGPALRQPRLAPDLRHLAQHHRGPQRPHQRPRPRSPRPARPPSRPGHCRPVPVHRAAADGRQHPQDPRLAGTDRRRQDRHRPPGTAPPGPACPATSPADNTARGSRATAITTSQPVGPGTPFTSCQQNAIHPPRSRRNATTSMRARRHTKNKATGRVLSV